MKFINYSLLLFGLLLKKKQFSEILSESYLLLFILYAL